MKAYIILIMGLFTIQAIGQQDSIMNIGPAPIKLIGEYQDGKVLLRWGPSSEGHWLNGQNAGYQIRRATVSNKGADRQEKEVLVAVLKPWSFEEFKSTVKENPDDSEMMIMGESIYGEWQTLGKKSNSMRDWGLRSEELKSKYLMAMLSADLDFEAAKAGALAFEDTNVKEGEAYAYYVTMVGYDQFLSAVEFVNTNKKTSRPVVRIDANYEGEKQVDMAWSRRLYEKHYTAYHVETSTDGKSYERITEIPFIHTLTDAKNIDTTNIIFTHRLNENYAPLYYRVRGIDAFGTLSDPSEAIRLMGRDRTPPAPPAIDTVMSDPAMNAIGIDWTYTDKAPDLALTKIKVSGYADGVFTDIVELPVFQDHFDDPINGTHARRFYKVCAVDTAGNEACAGPRIGIIDDKVPPVAPTGLTATIDSQGVVIIDWDDNPESDVKGYYVQLSNGKKRVFAPLVNSPQTESMFIDTLALNTLTEDVYYRVRAVDYSYNYGPYSEIIRLEKPDTIAPTASVIQKYTAKKDYIKLDYVLSASRDAERFVLQRKQRDGKWEEIKELAKGSRSFSDTNIDSDTWYFYRIKTWDDAGNQSHDLVEMRVKSPNFKLSQAPDLDIEVAGEDIILTWSEIKEKGADIKIYKGKNPDQLLSYKKLEDVNSFTDTFKENVHYRIKVYYSDGTYSPFSNIVTSTK